MLAFFKSRLGLALLSVVWVLTLCTSAGYVVSRSAWKAKLPKYIKVGRKLVSDTPVILSPGGSCGGAFYRLESKTKQKIVEQGLDFFTDAEWSRGNSYKYKWVANKYDGSLRAAMDCTTGGYMETRKLTSSIHSSSNNYFARAEDSKMQIAILGDKGLVFVGYWD